MTRPRKDSLDQLTDAMLAELARGPGSFYVRDGGSAFKSDADKREAWRRHRDRVEAHHERYPSHSCRPWAWWRFEAGEDPPEGPGTTHEVPLIRRAEFPWPWTLDAIRLHELGELTSAEEADLRAQEDPDRAFQIVLYGIVRAVAYLSGENPNYKPPPGAIPDPMPPEELAALKRWAETRGDRELETVTRYEDLMRDPDRPKLVE